MSSLRTHLQRLWGAEGAVLALALLRSLLVARILGVTEFGVAALATAFPSLVFMMLDPQSEEAVVRYSVSARQQGRGGSAVDVLRLAYRLDVLLALIGFVAVALALVLGVDERFGVPEDASHLVMGAAVGSALTAPAATARAWLVGARRSSDIALGGIAGGSLRFIGAVAGSALAGLDGFIAGTVAGASCELVVLRRLERRSVRSEFGRSRRPLKLDLDGRGREILRFMVLTDLTTLSSVMVKHLDLLVLGSFAGPAVAGQYRLARSVSSPAAAVLRPLQAVAYPRLVGLAASGGARELRREIRLYVVRLSLPLAVLGGLAVSAIPLALPLLAGAEYAAAGTPAVILGIGSVAGIAAFWVRPAALALGREGSLLVIGFCMTLLTVGSYFVLAEPFGAAGVAAARALFAVVVGSAIAAVVVRRAISHLDPGAAASGSATEARARR